MGLLFGGGEVFLCFVFGYLVPLMSWLVILFFFLFFLWPLFLPLADKYQFIAFHFLCTHFFFSFFFPSPLSSSSSSSCFPFEYLFIYCA